jgi:Tfp pilus assembly protein PilE
MWARARSESGFTAIELMLAVIVGTVGVVSLIATFDVSRRVTSFSEMKEAASHVAEQNIEEMLAVDYGKLALKGNPTPASSTDPNNPAYYLGVNGTGAKTFRWNQKANAPAGHTEPLVIDATNGAVPAAAEAWSDGRLRGSIHRYVTCAAAAVTACEQGPATSAYKRLTVAVTVDNAFGPEKAILVSTLVGNPEAQNGEGANPLDSPNTQCEDDGELVDCTRSVEGTVRTWYLYDTPATASARAEITGSHATHPTVAPSGTCTAAVTAGCPVPDLMGPAPTPAPEIAPPIYNYSSEITGGSTPGGAVVRRDAACNGTVTTTDNTKGHLWVSSTLSAPITVSGDAAMSISTQTFNGVTASATICIGFYNVPGNISNLVATPPTLIGAAQYTDATWPTAASNAGFKIDFLGDAAGVAIPAGRRLGVRVWVAASAGADLVMLYDHPLHGSYVQVNEEPVP